ncbi:mycobacterial-type methylenetetrahydrofolate reductase [Mycolicibacterium brumae]|uniref:Methylenetetrahydrofolate reductase (NAD(P)H) n=1 Tax=Mycolicibacterium brumae TaxID=85968 RepID=A0A2G5P5X1_9MYCO|nr:mycobacterial-type methylenetetrahydrofolate reductase [Mycolicibacterium brumae]MCV7191553.1 hypothetical protein [Mycolicibacterium brumae]PIB73666.1 hypothetical protein CQY22_016055 [Mycolicibacterium brumae]UWW09338.1 mycobacterial-type methylenetetrahydrofolate reductase [Mycolicibacterium brumae]
MPLRTVALELVPPNTDRGAAAAREEAHKVLRHAAQSGVPGRIGHVMLPAMIPEDDDRPVEMKPKLDVLDFWSTISPVLPGVRAICTQVTAFTDEAGLRDRLTRLRSAGVEGVIFVGVPRTMNDGDGDGVAPTDALSLFGDLVEHRGAILIPTRDGEQGRFGFKCDRGADFGMTQLLYSDAIVGFLREFGRTTDHRPEILLSFGFVPKVEWSVGLIDWLIRDPGNAAVAGEQAFVRELASADVAAKRRLLLDLYMRVVDGVVDLGFPLSLHLEAPYGVSGPAFDTFAEMLEYWSPA